MNGGTNSGFSGVNTGLTGKCRIKVIGVGGAGNNAVNRMITAGIKSAEYYVVNTDSQVLMLSPCENKLQIGVKLTKGLGAGADPDIGRKAAEESKEILTAAIKDTDLLFITAGMGGGTGTGAAPVIAKIARDMNILTIAIVTEPFSFEGRIRMDNTTKGLDNLKKYVDTLIVIPNDKIKTVVPDNTPLKEAFLVADDILKQGIKGLTELIVNPSLINLDFADVRTILKDRGIAHLGVGVSSGENRIVEAVRLAICCPLLETTIEGARGVILNVVGGENLSINEVTDAAELVKGVVDASANIIFGARIDPNAKDEVEITIIATSIPGFDSRREPEQPKTYNNGMLYDTANYPNPPQRRMTVNEPYYQPVVPANPQPQIPQVPQMPQSTLPQQTQPVQKTYQQISPAQPTISHNDDGVIERPVEDKDIPKFARLLRNLGKRRNDN
ncbi:MAG: cell division protein FtsZ [Clostridiales bacterium]|nr:cell division protein FtsZ [Clostridiales bacterium]